MGDMGKNREKREDEVMGIPKIRIRSRRSRFGT
jgi:hypothetical protein